ncbi:MAG: RNA polymerase sigma factor [Spirochaetales bacterium]|nr:RNA polymerase sigma factor [Spirochaetales bacterium]
MDNRNDNDLVKSVKRGDIEAFGTLVERHQSRLFFLGIKFFHNQEDAEDFAQEVFLKVFEKLTMFSGKVPFGAWLYKIAFNHAVNKYHVAKTLALAEQELPEDKEESVVIDDWDREQLKEEVNLALTELTDLSNIIIRMHFYDGLGYAEISDIMDIPVNTIKSHVHRAKKLIYNILQREGKSVGERI